MRDRSPHSAPGGKFRGVGVLANYRIYHVETGGRLRLGGTFQTRLDEEAIAIARPLLHRGQAAELWQGGRIVGRFSQAHDFSPGG